MSSSRILRFTAAALMVGLGLFSRALGQEAVNIRPFPSDNSVVRTADPQLRGLKREDFPRLYRVADGVYVYENLQRIGALEVNFTTNSFWVVTSDGVLVVDAMANDLETQKMLDVLHRVTNKPLKYLVIGADHSDHTGGDAVFPASTVLISTAYSAGRMREMSAARRPGASPLPIPSMIVQDRQILNLGGREIQVLNLGRAHTGGDLAVYLPKEKVMFGSEIYFNRLYPSTYSGYPSEWIAALKKMEAYDADVVLPGHGFVDSPRALKEELVNFRRSLEHLVAEGTRLYKAGVPVLQAPRQVNMGEFNYWTRASNNLTDGLARVYKELNGELGSVDRPPVVAPPPAPAR